MKRTGFTLIELMIVVLIIAVLAAIAIPSYQSYITRAARTKATRALLQAAGGEERYFYDHNTYAATVSSVGGATCVDSCSDSRYYTIAITQADAKTYSISATPKGAQATQDIACGTLTVNRAGQKTASGDPSNTKRCWGS